MTHKQESYIIWLDMWDTISWLLSSYISRQDSICMGDSCHDHRLGSSRDITPDGNRSGFLCYVLVSVSIRCCAMCFLVENHLSVLRENNGHSFKVCG